MEVHDHITYRDRAAWPASADGHNAEGKILDREIRMTVR
jgi:hypothetical protein